jgi:hypothetical protein
LTLSFPSLNPSAFLAPQVRDCMSQLFARHLKRMKIAADELEAKRQAAREAGEAQEEEEEVSKREEVHKRANEPCHPACLPLCLLAGC